MENKYRKQTLYLLYYEILIFSLKLCFHHSLPLTNKSLHWSFLLNNPFLSPVLLVSSVQVPCLYSMAEKIIILSHSEVVLCFEQGQVFHELFFFFFFFYSHSLWITLFIEYGDCTGSHQIPWEKARKWKCWKQTCRDTHSRSQHSLRH